MELDRSHFRSTTSDLFICFSSSSSSMKLTKSILSPGRPASLSSSLSRRLRPNGSLKGGGASPFFTTKKRGCGFDNPEPSSPKVTCIGQVRVKTKKKVRLSRRRSSEVSFRKIERSQNQECFPQRLAHLPVSICEGFKAISCFSSESGKRKEIELVVNGGDDEVEEKRVSFMRSSRRHVFDDFEVNGDKIEVKGQIFNVIKSCEEEKEKENGRMSVCVPPKNALLLMRCRSDPMKVAALASRFSWEARAAANVDVDDDNNDGNEDKEFVVSECECKNEIFMVDGGFEEGGDDKEEEEEPESNEMEDDGNKEVVVEKMVSEVNEEETLVEEELQKEISEVNEEETLVEEELQKEISEMNEEETLVEEELQKEIIEVNEEEKLVEEGDEVESNMSSFEDLLDQENADQNYEEDCLIQEDELVVVTESPVHDLSPSTESELEQDIENHESESVCPIPEETHLGKSENAITDVEYQLQQVPEERKPNQVLENQELKFLNQEPGKENESPPAALPDCLLLMMCEPKLSMEVSKETWVCRTDFIRWLPERPPKQNQAKATKAELPKRRLSTDTKPKQLEKMINILHQPATYQVQPPRSSCSLPPKAPSMATMIEQKLVNAVAYEPFVLTRCKSEPMRTAGSKLMPDSFYWKNAMRKLEPHRHATVGTAAGV